MKQPLIGKKLGKPRILVAPLDWGLGHATRCIPLIRELLDQECEPWLAGEGAVEQLLRLEFPQLPFLNLPGYRVRYASTGAGLPWQMLLQAGKFMSAIKKEHAWLMEKEKDLHFDAVISDNRYGLYHPRIPSVFITHQLHIKSPLGKWSERLIRQKNYRYINRFSECWVPDAPGEPNLAGELAHPVKLPGIPLRYTGPLSRFQPQVAGTEKNHLLFLLSGPEPQRSILENMIIAQIALFPGTACIVRGLPGERSLVPSTNMIRFYNHLPAGELLKEILAAEYIICRSGYSSIMDMAVLQKKMILVPTPGQTEQEYLSTWMMQQQRAFAVRQKDFRLEQVLETARKFSYRLPGPPLTQLKETVRSFLASL